MVNNRNGCSKWILGLYCLSLSAMAEDRVWVIDSSLDPESARHSILSFFESKHGDQVNQVGQADQANPVVRESNPYISIFVSGGDQDLQDSAIEAFSKTIYYKDEDYGIRWNAYLIVVPEREFLPVRHRDFISEPIDFCIFTDGLHSAPEACDMITNRKKTIVHSSAIENSLKGASELSQKRSTGVVNSCASSECSSKCCEGLNEFEEILLSLEETKVDFLLCRTMISNLQELSDCVENAQEYFREIQSIAWRVSGRFDIANDVERSIAVQFYELVRSSSLNSVAAKRNAKNLVAAREEREKGRSLEWVSNGKSHHGSLIPRDAERKYVSRYYKIPHRKTALHLKTESNMEVVQELDRVEKEMDRDYTKLELLLKLVP